MPVSKKPRRKQSKLQSPKRRSSAVVLPDRRAIEGFLLTIGGRQTEDAMAAAQDLMYSAWDQSSKRSRIDLARKALAISPLCADANVLLAEDEAKSAQE